MLYSGCLCHNVINFFSCASYFPAWNVSCCGKLHKVSCLKINIFWLAILLRFCHWDTGYSNNLSIQKQVSLFVWCLPAGLCFVSERTSHTWPQSSPCCLSHIEAKLQSWRGSQQVQLVLVYWQSKWLIDWNRFLCWKAERAFKVFLWNGREALFLDKNSKKTLPSVLKLHGHCNLSVFGEPCLPLLLLSVACCDFAS